MATAIQGTGTTSPLGGRRTVVVLLVAWMLLVAYGATKAPAGQRRAALVTAAIAALVLAFVGELAPGVAAGFAAILLVSMLLAGPSNGFAFLTKTVPKNLLQGGANG